MKHLVVFFCFLFLVGMFVPTTKKRNPESEECEVSAIDLKMQSGLKVIILQDGDKVRLATEHIKGYLL